MLEKVAIRGAREHNLKNIDIDIPHERLTVISGVSGSGKSSLAFDTLYAEGQRRYIESLTTYAKQFLERIARPDVDDVSGISPSIAIQQKNTTRSSRSTVGTTTEIYDYLRLLFARLGKTVCPTCEREVVRSEPDEVVRDVFRHRDGDALLVVAGMEVNGGLDALLERLTSDGYTRLLVKGDVLRIADVPRRRIARAKRLDVVLDRIRVEETKRTRLFEAVESAYRLADGFVRFHVVDSGEEFSYTSHLICPGCDTRYEEPRPLLFSFNTPYGACSYCRGFGNRMEFDERLIVPDASLSIRERVIDPWASEKFEYFFDKLLQFCRRKRISTSTPFRRLPVASQRAILDGDGAYTGVIPFLEEMREKAYKKYARFFTRRYMTFRECRQCRGGRLRAEAFNVRVGGRDIREVASMVPADALDYIESLEFSEAERTVATDILLELKSRLRFLLDVGLYYVTLNRLTKTLSGGEAQRINLANSLGANLVGVTYVLDEPSIGLHPRDTDRLINVLLELRDRGNTVVVVEHDMDIIRQADYLVDLGPGAGRHGGEVVYQGELTGASGNESRTLRYLEEGVPLANGRRSSAGRDESIVLHNVREHNLKALDVRFPIGAFTAVTGVSGSGKSTLVCEVLYNALVNSEARHTYAFDAIDVDAPVEKTMLVDQSPIGKTPRSNPATYIKAFAAIRDIFAAHRESRKRGYTSGRFSFNVPGGRCARCEGMGYERIEMHFMADMYVRCPECDGQRFNADTLEIRVGGLNLAEVLDLTVSDALSFFGDHRALVSRLQQLERVGLGYLQLGQPSTTLSGGESQRIKIARELAENVAGCAVYILDEPTTGLHVDDIETLIDVLRELVSGGNTVVVVEHNPQVIMQADHIIDLGPEGGEDGGRIVAQGLPFAVMKAKGSHTGSYLKQLARRQRKGKP